MMNIQTLDYKTWIYFYGFSHVKIDSGFLMFNLTSFGPLFTDFFQFFRFSDIPFEVTAILTYIIIKCSNGNNADGDAVAAEGTAFRQYLNSRIHFFRSTFGAFSLFQVDTSLPGINRESKYLVLVHYATVFVKHVTRTYLKNNLSAHGSVAKRFKMLTYYVYAPLFHRFAPCTNLIFEIGSIVHP